MGSPMLIALSIRNFVLIRSLELELGDGFTALTGETGAGKSIILAALGFVLGGRGDKSMIRPGADAASITAEFTLGGNHAALSYLEGNGVEIADGESIVVRRQLKSAGGSRAWLNDMPVSARLLQGLGDYLVEIHGQHASHTLTDPARQRRMLDDFAQAGEQLARTRSAFQDWRLASEARAAIEARQTRLQDERDFLEHAVAELDTLDPQPDEAAALAAERTLLQSSERTAQAVEDAVRQFDKAAPEHALAQAARALGRAAALPVMEETPEDAPLKLKLAEAVEAVERALIEAGEAADCLTRLKNAADYSPDALEHAEARLFALRAAGRKFDVDPDRLSLARDRMRLQLEEIDHADQSLADAIAAENTARSEYLAAAQGLSGKREKSAKALSRAVQAELSPLKLGKAKFRVNIAPLAEADAGPGGLDDIRFEIETNPGAGFAPLQKIASGGELARFSLALKMCVAHGADAGVLIFDEADVGVGGAVAAAIGERLHFLSGDRQVLAITHSPQVAAAAKSQWRIFKGEGEGGAMETDIDVLGAKDRREEIARMLAGAQVTREARAAANRLLAGA